MFLQSVNVLTTLHATSYVTSTLIFGCLGCPPGSWGTFDFITFQFVCTSCLAGTYADATSISDFEGCKDCPVGTWSDPGAESVRQCTST